MMVIYDEECEEFVVYLLMLMSIKWWLGGLGKTFIYVVVMVRLFIKGVDYGVYLFVV